MVSLFPNAPLNRESVKSSSDASAAVATIQKN